MNRALETGVLSKNARRLLRLARQQDGLCYWCKREMILPGQPGYYRGANLKGRD